MDRRGLKQWLWWWANTLFKSTLGCNLLLTGKQQTGVSWRNYHKSPLNSAVASPLSFLEALLVAGGLGRRASWIINYDEMQTFTISDKSSRSHRHLFLKCKQDLSPLKWIPRLKKAEKPTVSGQNSMQTREARRKEKNKGKEQTHLFWNHFLELSSSASSSLDNRVNKKIRLPEKVLMEKNPEPQFIRWNFLLAQTLFHTHCPTKCSQEVIKADEKDLFPLPPPPKLAFRDRWAVPL